MSPLELNVNLFPRALRIVPDRYESIVNKNEPEHQ